MSEQSTGSGGTTATATPELRPVWDGLGENLDKAKSSQEAMKNAGLDWTVEQHDLKASGGIKVPNHVANIRSDTKEVLGIVGKESYKLIQNVDAFRFVDSLAVEGQMRYVSAGALAGGKRVWLLAEMPEQLKIVGDDVIQQCILFVTGHDGKLRTITMPTGTRFWCGNTLRLAMQNRDLTRTFSVQHTGNTEVKLDEVRNILVNLGGLFKEHVEVAKQLVKRKVTADDVSSFLTRIWPDQQGANNSRREKVREEVAGLMEAEPQQLKGVAGTGWAAYNAVSQWADHNRVQPRKEEASGDRVVMERRFDSALFGVSHDVKVRAFETATRLWVPKAPKGRSKAKAAADPVNN